MSGAPPGTRTLGPLIKRASRRFVSIYGSFEPSLFLIKSTWFFTQQFLHPLSDFAAKSTLCTFWNRAKSVQKPCTYSLTNKIALFPTDLTALVWVAANSSQQHRNTAFSPENIFYCVFETHWWFSPWRREKALLHPFQFKERCKIYYDHELLPLWDYSGCTLQESCFKPINQRKIKKS